MRIVACLAACVISLMCWRVVPAFSSAGEAPVAKPQEIAYHEAEILIYLLPVAKELRAGGMDVSWERQTSAKLNQEDYFVFWVVNARRVSNGSVTVGYFAVNKHTADVWDSDLKELVTSPEIKGVQKILRRAHRIDDHAIEEYRARPIDSSGN